MYNKAAMIKAVEFMGMGTDPFQRQGISAPENSSVPGTHDLDFICEKLGGKLINRTAPTPGVRSFDHEFTSAYIFPDNTLVVNHTFGTKLAEQSKRTQIYSPNSSLDDSKLDAFSDYFSSKQPRSMRDDKTIIINSTNHSVNTPKQELTPEYCMTRS